MILSLLLSASLSLRAQEEEEFVIPDSIDISALKKFRINNYSMIGVNYGVNYNGMSFNPSQPQKRKFNPGYFSVMYTHYEKMFDYLPYFGFQVGVEYGTEGYSFKERDNGRTFYYPADMCTDILMHVIEVPFLAQLHYDARFFKILADAGVYAGYRLDIDRTYTSYLTSSQTDYYSKYKNDFFDYDNRFDFGLEFGLGMGLVFSPVEFHVTAMCRYAWSSLFQPNTTYPAGSRYESYNDYYYRFAYPFDFMITGGVYIHLSRRNGKTNAELRRQAKEIVYGTEEN